MPRRAARWRTSWQTWGWNRRRRLRQCISEPETPTAPTHRTVQNFWQEPAPEPQKQRSQSRAKQKPAKAAPPPQQEEPAAPRLSGTIQMDSDFQKFFSESVAVIPDLEQEQHPGFFARFVGRRKNAEAQDDEEGLDAEDYSTELNTTEEDEPEERAPRRRRFGFWHKWNEDEEDAAEEETGEEPEESPEEEEEQPVKEREPFHLFHRERRAQPQGEPASGTVELPLPDQAPARPTPWVDQAPARPMTEPIKPVRPQPVGTVQIDPVESPTVEVEPAEPARSQPVGTVQIDPVESPTVEVEPAEPARQQPEEPAVDDTPTRTAPEPEKPIQPAEADQPTMVLRPEELELDEHPTGSVQLDVEWDNEPGPDATRVLKDDAGKGGAPRLLGDEAPGEPFAEEPGPEYVEDYESPADAPIVQQRSGPAASDHRHPHRSFRGGGPGAAVSGPGGGRQSAARHRCGGPGGGSHGLPGGESGAAGCGLRGELAGVLERHPRPVGCSHAGQRAGSGGCWCAGPAAGADDEGRDL